MTRLLLETSAATNPASQWAVIALGAFTVVYIGIIRPMRKGKQPKDPLQRSPAQHNLARERAVERDLAGLLVEYEEMIRRMTAQVDTRAAKLELLIGEADAKLAELRSARAPLESAATTTLSPPAAVDAPPLQPTGPTSPAADGVVFGALAVATPPATTAPDPPADGVGDARHADIYDLADQGRSAREIARQLNRRDGEVDLILALREPRRPPPREVEGQPGATPAPPAPTCSPRPPDTEPAVSPVESAPSSPLPSPRHEPVMPREPIRRESRKQRGRRNTGVRADGA